ncbi:MAG: tRNA preQ1(34) S-adenosylmethionine ribosyltransferase-isomerase QueA [Nitrospirota bacterium]
MLNITDFDYPFDPLLIAQYPLEKRDQSRLLVLDKINGKTAHRIFSDIGEFLSDGDILVLNNTRVFPCRVIGEKEETGGRVELLLIKEAEGENRWEVISNKKLKEGTIIRFSKTCRCEVTGKYGTNYIVKFHYTSDWKELLSNIGQMPLPPYIRRAPSAEDRERYQTVYASEDGAIAAPTAGLHFTDELLGNLNLKGIRTVYVTLHVGIGTFRPVKSEFIDRHRMEHERFNVSKEVVELIRQTREKKGRVIAVGTTSVRALEQAALTGDLRPAEGETGIFIYPGFKFKVVDAMITNFHLPKSTLIMLVMALAGRENILRAYDEAVLQRYRFYSYGDAMLII